MQLGKELATGYVRDDAQDVPEITGAQTGPPPGQQADETAPATLPLAGTQPLREPAAAG